MATAYPEPAQKMLVRRLVNFWIRPLVCVGGDLGWFRFCCFGDDLLLLCPSSLPLPTSVGPLVPRNGALAGEPHWAHGASVGLLPRVRPLVLGNVALVGEAPWAHGASVGLLPGVGPLVPRNVALLGEAPRAHGASVGLLPDVGPHVPGCFTLLAKLLGAVRAIKGGGVDPLVLRQRSGTPEPLLAVPT